MIGDLFSTKKLVTSILGIGGVLGGGGYGAVNYLGNQKLLDVSSFDTENISEKVNEKITFAEYITKDYLSGGKINGICKKWKGGRVVIENQDECEKKIKEKWDGKTNKQPEVWFNADSKNILEALKDHFSENTSFEESMFSENQWKVSELTCRKTTHSDKDQIEVSCAFEDKEE
ncbi:hypothetical protein [Mycoplasma suis]|uniref:Uncharacterized protein n=1 Tax=Mycoplasma suis (strain Illinois) TaxID=768700 RepID=F0QQJ3_MYCSL|nr:hypothetical protein [Mycoplasma suis]ADX97763.1 hypothetical protein MSU_0219 [Mycoplasma suis str. Illinois]